MGLSLRHLLFGGNRAGSDPGVFGDIESNMINHQLWVKYLFTFISVIHSVDNADLLSVST
jgi:hypothetical protein